MAKWKKVSPEEKEKLAARLRAVFRVGKEAHAAAIKRRG